MAELARRLGTLHDEHLFDNWKPSSRFRWDQIEWLPPEHGSAEFCGYCSADLDADDAVPMIFIEEATGWTATFCGNCQAAWFGIGAD